MISLSFLHLPIALLGLMTNSLDELVLRCAPTVGPTTMKAIVSVESGGNPYAINDDTAKHSYSPRSLLEALAIAQGLLAENHNFDAGIAQVNSVNFSHEGLGLGNMFDPCANLAAGARILGRSYAAAAAHLWIEHTPRTQQDAHLQEQLSLYHAFSVYNSGSAWKSLGYAAKVVNAAQSEIGRRPFILLPTTRSVALVQPLPQTLAQPHAPAAILNGFRPIASGGQKRATGFSATHHPSIEALEILAANASISPKLGALR